MLPLIQPVNYNLISFTHFLTVNIIHGTKMSKLANTTMNLDAYLSLRYLIQPAALTGESGCEKIGQNSAMAKRSASNAPGSAPKMKLLELDK